MRYDLTMGHTNDPSAIAHRKQRFLEELERGQNVAAACRTVGINNDTPYYWRETDPAFRSAMDEVRTRGRARGVDALEDTAFTLALGGNLEAIKLLLKAWSPERYHERLQIAQSVQSRVIIELDDPIPTGTAVIDVQPEPLALPPAPQEG